MDEISPYLPGIGLAYSAFLLSIMSPGPKVLAIMGTSMSVGRPQGVALGLGVAAGSFCWAMLNRDRLVGYTGALRSRVDSYQDRRRALHSLACLQGVSVRRIGTRYGDNDACECPVQFVWIFSPRPRGPDDQSESGPGVDCRHLPWPKGGHAVLGRRRDHYWNNRSLGYHSRALRTCFYAPTLQQGPTLHSSCAGCILRLRGHPGCSDLRQFAAGASPGTGETSQVPHKELHHVPAVQL
jgi:hypothetical protein